MRDAADRVWQPLCIPIWGRGRGKGTGAGPPDQRKELPANSHRGCQRRQPTLANAEKTQHEGSLARGHRTFREKPPALQSLLRFMCDFSARMPGWGRALRPRLGLSKGPLRNEKVNLCSGSIFSTRLCLFSTCFSELTQIAQRCLRTRSELRGAWLFNDTPTNPSGARHSTEPS